eukprot:scaffold305224_cov31-Tisochrysis_lutea.AAC.1
MDVAQPYFVHNAAAIAGAPFARRPRHKTHQFPPLWAALRSSLVFRRARWPCFMPVAFASLSSSRSCESKRSDHMSSISS